MPKAEKKIEGRKKGFGVGSRSTGICFEPPRRDPVGARAWRECYGRTGLDGPNFQECRQKRGTSQSAHGKRVYLVSGSPGGGWGLPPTGLYEPACTSTALFSEWESAEPSWPPSPSEPLPSGSPSSSCAAGPSPRRARPFYGCPDPATRRLRECQVARRRG